ncbi:MAG: HAD hydrolase-like protein, partial [Candidatus Altiarchaeota archaeon]
GDAVFVGDSYTLDVEGAKNAGLKAVLIDRKDKPYLMNQQIKPDAVIFNLEELIPLLKTL